MKRISLIAAAAALISTIGLSPAAQAASIVKKFEATSAVGAGGADHSLWIKGGLGSNGGVSLGSDFDFDPAGILTIFDNDTMTLGGNVVSQSDSGAGFKINFEYDKNFGFTPQFKVENGSQPTPETEYWNLKGGTMMGTGLLAGLNLSVSRMPADGPFATQLGPSNGTDNGANNKNKNLGMANWFFMSIDSNTCVSVFCDGKDFSFLNGRQGDINIDLSAVPLPAGGLLLLTGLAGLAVARRRKT